MKATSIAGYVAMLPLCGVLNSSAGPLPEFTYEGINLHPDDLGWIPTGELEHPAFIKMEGLVEDPLGKYYLYYAPHKHHGIGLAYSDNLDGPWKEYDANPVVKGPAAPDIRWIDEKKKFYMWGHTKNSQTELWTSDDGIHFEHKGTSIKGSNIGTKNATYTRFYEHPLEQYGSRYIMLYSGYAAEKGVRCVWLAHSKDAEQWTQLKTPLVEPVADENEQLYCPALFVWRGRNFVVYADCTSWRGGRLKYVELDRDLNPVGVGGERYLLMEPPDALARRLRSPEFHVQGDVVHMISGGGRNPRVIVYGKASAASPEARKEIGEGRAERPDASPAGKANPKR